MKIRALAVAAALAASGFALNASPAAAWTCPKDITRTIYVQNPVTGGQHQACAPDLNCETCFADVR